MKSGVSGATFPMLGFGDDLCFFANTPKHMLFSKQGLRLSCATRATIAPLGYVIMAAVVKRYE